MTRIPYITPATELLPVQTDAVLCVSPGAGTEPFEDNGDYDWGA